MRINKNIFNENSVRLNKFIAERGLCSRRAADRWIEDGQVTINGKKVYELGIKINPNEDKISVKGKLITKEISDKIYIMFHKPKGILTTMEDPLDRPTIKGFLKEVPHRVFPIGRLDWDSEGLLLLTNDGDYANKVAHPKVEVTKTYLVKLDGRPDVKHFQKLLSGVTIVGGKVAAKSVQQIKRGADKYAWIKIIITEGKNRQIRQMFEKIGFDVLKLQRVAIGSLRLRTLPRGEMVFLNDAAAKRVFIPDLGQEESIALKKKQNPRQRSHKRPS